MSRPELAARLAELPVAANLSLLYDDRPLPERFSAARNAGFRAVELWWPFGRPDPAERAMRDLVGAAQDAGVQVTCLNLDAGDTAAGDRGLLSVPAQQSRVEANLRSALRLVAALGCRRINALYGNRVAGADPEEQDAHALRNLAALARRFAEHDVTVLVETLNSHDSPRYPLVRAAATAALVERVRDAAGQDNVALLLDTYHLAQMGADPAATIRRHGELLGHLQLADWPGRGRPGTGTIDFGAVLDAARGAGYIDHLGLEFVPDPTQANHPTQWVAPVELAEVEL